MDTQVPEPAGRGEDVVIQEGHNVAGCLQDPPVARPVHPPPFLPDEAHATPKLLFYLDVRAVYRTVVHNDNFVRLSPLLQKGEQASSKVLPSVERGNDNGQLQVSTLGRSGFCASEPTQRRVVVRKELIIGNIVTYGPRGRELEASPVAGPLPAQNFSVNLTGWSRSYGSFPTMPAWNVG